MVLERMTCLHLCSLNIVHYHSDVSMVTQCPVKVFLFSLENVTLSSHEAVTRNLEWIYPLSTTITYETQEEIIPKYEDLITSNLSRGARRQPITQFLMIYSPEATLKGNNDQERGIRPIHTQTVITLFWQHESREKTTDLFHDYFLQSC